MTTLAYVVIDPDARVARRIVSAGHPPPLLIDPRRARLATCRCEGDLAARRRRARTTASPSTRSRCPAGSLCCFTDGARRGARRVARRRASSACALVAERRRPRPRGAVRRGGERMAPTHEPTTWRSSPLRVPPLPEHFAQRWPAEPEALRGVRQLLRRWLRKRGADEDEIYDITVAVQEAWRTRSSTRTRPGRPRSRSRRVTRTARSRRSCTTAGSGATRAAERSAGADCRSWRALMETVDVAARRGGARPSCLSRTLGSGRRDEPARRRSRRGRGATTRRSRTSRARSTRRTRPRSATACARCSQPLARPGRRPDADDLHRQRRHQPAVRARRGAAGASAAASTSCSPRARG